MQFNYTYKLALPTQMCVSLDRIQINWWYISLNFLASIYDHLELDSYKLKVLTLMMPTWLYIHTLSLNPTTWHSTIKYMSFQCIKLSSIVKDWQNKICVNITCTRYPRVNITNRENVIWRDYHPRTLMSDGVGAL